jgi:hypothetical protein
MAGTKNDVLVGKNADFSRSAAPTPQSGEANGLVLNGDLWIGSTALNVGGTHINVGRITSPLGTLIVGYSSPNITLDLAGGSTGIDSIAVQTGITPVLPTAAGLISFNGLVVAAGVNPVRTDGTGPNTIALEVQISQALAAADATKIGLSNFSSTDFAVAATGFVTLSTTGAGKTITGDTGVISPIANNWNILGGPGITTSGAGNTLTINGVTFSDNSGIFTAAVDNGYFLTAASTVTLPAAPAQGEVVRIIVDTTGSCVITANTGQIIRINNDVSSTAGTATNSARGDALWLVYRTTGAVWIAENSIGLWTLA